MIEAISCGGVVIFRGKILLLYKNIKNKYEGWVLPKGTVEPGETHEEKYWKRAVPGHLSWTTSVEVNIHLPYRRMW